MPTYSERELTEIFFEALECFNEALESDICRENTLLTFFTPENGIEVYERFCSKHFPQFLRENYKAEGYMESFAAQAFVGESFYGVMIRSDLDDRLAVIHQIFLHEISHLFCTVNEVEGGHFFDRYCMGSGVEDGIINAGYAVWREAVADIMADSILVEYTPYYLREIIPEVKRLYRKIVFDNPDAKLCMSLIIKLLFNTKEIGGSNSWEQSEKALQRYPSVADPMYIETIHLIWDKLHQSPFWEITEEFIKHLGVTYLQFLEVRTMSERFHRITQKINSDSM